MIILILILLGLCFGSFVNALVWRLHQNETKPAKNKSLSIWQGRSMCPNCKHQLAAIDLVPVLSWLSLKGRCRYCKKPISWQYPVVEAVTAGTYLLSYIFWPNAIQGLEWLYFGLWLAYVTAFMALLVYDVRWQLLPNKIIYPLIGLASAEALIKAASATDHLAVIVTTIWGAAIGGGIFYFIFQISNGKWIGGGDVKLGTLLGIIIGGPAYSFLVLFLAACLGSAWSLPQMVLSRLSRTSRVAFGPFLIIAAVVVQLAGAAFITWYKRSFLILS